MHWSHEAQPERHSCLAYKQTISGSISAIGSSTLATDRTIVDQGQHGLEVSQ